MTASQPNYLKGLLEDEAESAEVYGRDHGQYSLVGKAAAIRDGLVAGADDLAADEVSVTNRVIDFLGDHAAETVSFETDYVEHKSARGIATTLAQKVIDEITDAGLA